MATLLLLCLVCFVFPYYIFLAKNETTNTKTIAPISDGTIAIPPMTGPHVPNKACPIAEPISPAIIFAMIPIEEPLLVIAPAMAPMTPLRLMTK